jgi:histidine triad (HIT) family protein
MKNNRKSSMHNHAPENYDCPFCKIAKGIEGGNVATRQEDVFYQDDKITAFVSSHWWPNNEGHVLIIPNEHVENIYSLSDELSFVIHSFEKKVAIAIKEIYECDGVSSRQHNESGGGQDVFHYHLHIYPRYEGDRMYEMHGELALSDAKKRSEFAQKLREYFSKNKNLR